MKRTLDLLIPMPKATVATMIGVSSRTKARWLRWRVGVVQAGVIGQRR